MYYIVLLFNGDFKLIMHGCDASMLLDNSKTFISEKISNPNCNLTRGFEVIDEIKSTLKKACLDTVSCADILAPIERDSTILVSLSLITFFWFLHTFILTLHHSKRY